MVNVRKLDDPKIKCDISKIYSPSEDSFLIIDYFKKAITEELFDGIDLEEIKFVLDLGTGTGIIAIFFELIKKFYINFNPKIYASDILEEAIECARLNEKLNNITNQIEFIRSNLFESFPDSLKHSFDIVVFNPPYLPSLKHTEETRQKRSIDFSWDGGLKGYEILLEFFDNVKEYLNLKKSPRIYYICSNRTNIIELNKLVEKKGFKTVEITKKHVFFEDIILNRAEII